MSAPLLSPQGRALCLPFCSPTLETRTPCVIQREYDGDGLYWITMGEEDFRLVATAVVDDFGNLVRV